MSTKAVASTAVARVRKSAAPRADISPAGPPPMPSPPPSDRCIRITPTSDAAISAWTTSRKVNIGGLFGKEMGAGREAGRSGASSSAGARRVQCGHEARNIPRYPPRRPH